MAKEKYSYGYAQEKYRPFKQKEEVFNFKLEETGYYIIRFDGKEMTKAFKIKRQAINEKFFKTMEDAFKEFCKTTENIVFGYSFSDEISILIKRSKNQKSENNRIEKLLSLLAGRLALIFNRKALENQLDLQGKDWVFDARIIKLSKEKVVEYFLARQAFAIDKYIMQLKGENLIDYRLNNSQQVLEELKNKGINYESLPEKYRYGLIYSKTKEAIPFEFEANKTKLKRLCFKHLSCNKKVLV